MNEITTERPPWELTTEEEAQIAAAVTRLTAERMAAYAATLPEHMRSPEHTACERHEFAGACTQECADAENAMTDGGPYESMVYSDYLGGEVGYDVSGCHGGPPMPETTAVLDADRKAVVYRTEHPADCYCGKPECPAVIREDAYAEVMGDRSSEAWTPNPDGPGWVRVNH